MRSLKNLQTGSINMTMRMYNNVSIASSPRWKSVLAVVIHTIFTKK